MFQLHGAGFRLKLHLEIWIILDKISCVKIHKKPKRDNSSVDNHNYDSKVSLIDHENEDDKKMKMRMMEARTRLKHCGKLL